MNTFKKYSKNIPAFYTEIISSNPDYIVPVERKGCKLIRLLQLEHGEGTPQIRYKQFFDNVKPDLKGKRIAVIDDASKYTSSLYEYRLYFEALGAEVSTYSFVGQESLCTGKREQYDEKAIIFQFLQESTYQEYIIQQSIELSNSEHAFDIDHLVFQTQLTEERYIEFIHYLSEVGEIDYTNDVYTPEHISKFCCFNFNFPVCAPFTTENGVYEGSLIKIRFAYNHNTQCLSIVPMHYPTWDINTFSHIKNDLLSLPFEMPYESTPSLEHEGVFMNIIFVCNLYLLKAFLKEVDSFSELHSLDFICYDLIAYIGDERYKKVVPSVQSFLQSRSDDISNILPLPKSPKSTKKFPEFCSIMAVMKHLRCEYERLLRNKSVLNVRYFLSFDELYSRYTGKADLIKWIDILCDRGVMVTRNVILDGYYCRACRSGEADYDHIEKKTTILLPIIINMCGRKVGKTFRIKATLLNKIIANLSYDYPMDSYDFHNFFTKPYFYGPFSYAKNRLNDEIETPLYKVEKISSFCTYDENEGEFLSIDCDLLKEEIDAFSQSDLVPLSEITAYVDFLYRISDCFGKADALNQLVICRDQDIYYRHVHFDIITAYNNLLTAYRTSRESNAERYLRDAAKVANEAEKKLKYNQKELFDKLSENFGSDIRFRTAYNRINETKVDFDQRFYDIIINLRSITFLEQALINIMLYKYSLNKQYLTKFIKISESNQFVDSNILNDIKKLVQTLNDDEYNRLYQENIETIGMIINTLYDNLCVKIRNLPKPQDSDYVLSNKKRDMEVAINKCIQYVKKRNYRKFAILHFDFSGYRNIEGDKSINIIEQVQKYVSFLMSNTESGNFIYGLIGSHTFGTIVFDTVNRAIQFSKKLQQTFHDLGMNQVNFKFGCCYNNEIESLYDDIKSTWTEASICSRLSTSQKNNYAGFVISDKTYSKIERNLKCDFMMVNNNAKTYYLHSDFEDIDSNSIKKYDTDTDENVRIGIITALTEEFVAMQKMLTNPKTAVFPKSSSGKNKSIGREFCVGSIRSLEGKEHRIALTQTIGPGNTAAANRANCLLERFPNLDVIIMTGIAGGIPTPADKNKHVRLGDIVVATEIIPYDFVSEKSNIIELRGRNVPPVARLVEAQKHLDRIAFMNCKPWEKYIDKVIMEMPKLYARPSDETDVLFDHHNNPIPHPFDESRNNKPYIFQQKIASANRVLKNPVKRDQLKAMYDVYAVEMEGSGIADASWEAEIGYYVIRGISDYCDGNKNDIWHNYAALAAAAYTRALIEKLPY